MNGRVRRDDSGGEGKKEGGCCVHTESCGFLYLPRPFFHPPTSIFVSSVHPSGSRRSGLWWGFITAMKRLSVCDVVGEWDRRKVGEDGRSSSEVQRDLLVCAKRRARCMKRVISLKLDGRQCITQHKAFLSDRARLTLSQLGRSHHRALLGCSETGQSCRSSRSSDKAMLR